jgi:hypothetical protein
MHNADNTQEKDGHKIDFMFVPGQVPKTPVIWPQTSQHTNQIQQTKGSAKPQSFFTLPTTQPGQSPVPPRTTPTTVSAVRIVTRIASDTQKQVTVQFNHPPGSPYFAGANVYLKRANGQPILVASGAKSPITFTANHDPAPHSIYVTSVGNWGETNVGNSPSAPVRLGKSA